MLRQRLLSAILLIPLVLIGTYLGGLWFAALVLVAALLASYEFVQIARYAGYQLSFPLLMGMVAVLLLAAGVEAAFPEPQGIQEGSNLDLTRLGLTMAILLSFAWQIFLPNDSRSVVSWGLTLAGGLYLGILGSLLVAVRNLPGGAGWAMWALLATWANDTGAYIAGKLLGRHKFSPTLSPRKTWEGSIGGWLACLAASLAIGSILQVPVGQSAWLGVVLGPAGTLGDLAVSFLKRQIGVKDTGNLIPGHGGMLDRLDSLLFSAAVVYYWVVWR